VRFNRMRKEYSLNRKPKLGLIAYEYPPLVGGMATYAQALAEHMHRADWEVHVFTNEKARNNQYAIVHPVLTTDLARDLPTLNRFNMDLWHSINFGYAPVAMLKRPFVLTVHGTDFLRPWVWPKLERVPFFWRMGPWLKKQTPRRLLYQHALRHVDRIVTCSRFSARRFQKEYPFSHPPTVVHNGVNPNFIRQSHQAHETVRHPQRLLTVCNLGLANKRKNIDGVIRAMALVAEHLNLEYWIVGDGSARCDLQELARKLGIDHRVHFLGRLNEDQLMQAYASSSLFTLVPRPEADDVEGFGIVYLEAAAMGTPSLAGRFGGATEAVSEGHSGFFAEDSDPTAIANALEQFFTGHVHFDIHKIQAHTQKFTWPTLLKQVEKIYQPLLPKNAQPIKAESKSVQESPVPVIHRPKRPAAKPNWTNWIQSKLRPLKKPHGGRVLFISYPFPPVGGSPVQRPAKLAKYLPQWGWDVEILTAAHDRFPWYDETLLVDIPAKVRVHRIPGYEPACLAEKIGSLLCRFSGTDACNTNPGGPGRQGGQPGRRIIDALYWRMAKLMNHIGRQNGESLWIQPAVKAALRLHRRRPFDVLVSTGPPHFTHQVAQRVAHETNLPWIAELRDPLLSDFDRTAPRHQQVQHQKRLERMIMKNADRVITTCETLKQNLLSRYPQGQQNTIHVVTNGFDRDDLKPLTNENKTRNKRDFVFIAAGAFYGRREIARLINPLQQVLNKHPQWQGRVRITVAGTLDAQQRRQWEKQKPAWLNFAGYLNHASTIQQIASAHCAILVVPSCRHSYLSVPGKTFELLALPTHLLALVAPDSPTEHIVQSAGGATIAPFEDSARTAEAMENIIRAHFAGTLNTERNWTELDQYDRALLAGQYACWLSQAAQHPPVEISFDYFDDQKKKPVLSTEHKTQHAELAGVA